MYTVIRFDAAKKVTDKDNTVVAFKNYRSKKAALKCAYKRNNMISTQVIAQTYAVWDHVQKQLLEAVRVA